MDSLELRLHEGVRSIPAARWDALRCDDQPFLAHAFLCGLEEHDCIRADFGWRSCPLGLYRDGQLVAAAPLYLKDNSHGEFVFDWSWASSYARHGLDYYPKMLAAVPYTPVSGTRLLVGSGSNADDLRRDLLAGIENLSEQLGLSSVHLNFASPADAQALAGSAWLARSDWQFHWCNRRWRDFDEFLDALRPRKRKNIQQERQRVVRAGVHCEIRHGDELHAAEWRAVHLLYRATFEAHGNHPALTEAFFRHLGRELSRQVVVVLCHRGARIIAAAFFLRDSVALYGRYWGAQEQVPGLHFEACYYQGIEYCLAHGLQRFEPGAQGEHKIARGFLPQATRSFHRIFDPRFSSAIGDALQREALALETYRSELLAHDPYRQAEDTR
jgi:predicted N-acyltransferase